MLAVVRAWMELQEAVLTESEKTVKPEQEPMGLMDVPNPGTQEDPTFLHHLSDPCYKQSINIILLRLNRRTKVASCQMYPPM